MEFLPGLLTAFAGLLLARRNILAWPLALAAAALASVPGGRDAPLPELLALPFLAYGWWCWTRTPGRFTRSVTLRPARRTETILGLVLALLAGFVAAAPLLPAVGVYGVPAWLLAGYLLAAMPVLALLGFAHGVIQSWLVWLAAPAAALLTTAATAPPAASLPSVLALGVGLYGYRSWRPRTRAVPGPHPSP